MLTSSASLDQGASLGVRFNVRNCGNVWPSLGGTGGFPGLFLLGNVFPVNEGISLVRG